MPRSSQQVGPGHVERPEFRLLAQCVQHRSLRLRLDPPPTGSGREVGPQTSRRCSGRGPLQYRQGLGPVREGEGRIGGFRRAGPGRPPGQPARTRVADSGSMPLDVPEARGQRSHGRRPGSPRPCVPDGQLQEGLLRELTADASRGSRRCRCLSSPRRRRYCFGPGEVVQGVEGQQLPLWPPPPETASPWPARSPPGLATPGCYGDRSRWPAARTGRPRPSSRSRP